MPKNALFLLKICKNRRALGALLQTPATAPITNSWLRACSRHCLFWDHSVTLSSAKNNDLEPFKIGP